MRLTQSDLRTFARKRLHTCLGVPGKNLKKKSLRKRLILIELFEDLWSVGTRFRH